MTQSTLKPPRAQKREERLANPERLPFGKLVAWAGAGLSAAGNFLILGYLTLYATDVLGMAPAVIGGLIGVATALNGLMAFAAAWMVDRSPETRWGKARPYEWAIPLLWLATALLFAVPPGLRESTGQVAWMAGMFLVIKAIADPLLRANDTVYMARAFASRMVYAKVSTRAGIFTALGAVVISITLPRLLAGAGNSADQWARIIAIYSVILAVVGMSRFFFVKEQTRTAVLEEPLRVGHILEALKANRWIWLLAATQFCAAAVTGANVGAYYFKWVTGDLALQGTVLAFGIVLLPLLLVVPRLMRRFAVSQIILTGAVIGAIGGIINFFAGMSVPLLILGLLLTSLAALPLSYLIVVLILDLATYNESCGRRRLESTLTAVVGLSNNIGMAVAAGFVGMIMSAAGYVGDATVQHESAVSAIRALFGLLPAALFALIAILMLRYSRFERNVLPSALEQVRQQRDVQAAPKSVVAVDANGNGTVDPEELPMPPLLTNTQGIPSHTDPSHAAGPLVPYDDRDLQSKNQEEDSSNN